MKSTAYLSDLAQRLAVALGPDLVDSSARRRAEYSSDASNYRVVPEVVVFPESGEHVASVIEICREFAAPLTARGGGTSCAGNAVGPGVVLDFSRHFNRVISLDPRARTACVEPGVTLDSLQDAARAYGLRFGPDPSSHSRCTVGGMVGNNACGTHAMVWGTTAENVVSLDVIDGVGRKWTAGSGLNSIEVVPGLASFVEKAVRPVSSEFGRLSRQVSGYSLQHLLPEYGSNVARALVGTEGSCGVVVSATLALVEIPKATALAVLGYPDMASSADAIPDMLGFQPLALEGIDARLVDVVRRHKGASKVPDLPSGQAWIFAEFEGETEEDALTQARRFSRSTESLGSLVVPAGRLASRLWAIREDGAGLGGRTPEGLPAWPAWEDSAVPPASLGNYLREFESLLLSHRLNGLLYGHFGDGCVHIRIDLPLEQHPEVLRPFLLEAAALVIAHGGSLSGEHGDGRARSELLPLMYSREAITAFAGFKHLFDPSGILNPGVVVKPAGVDAGLRLPLSIPVRSKAFRLSEDSGDLSRAVHRCVGIGKCRSESSDTGDWMCPSYLATRDEKDSTRGRARVLQEMANGSLISGFRSSEVTESLELCLSCKACSRDCPASVDMATYKSEVIYQRYRGRRRPASHYALGRLPLWTSWSTMAPASVDRILRVRLIARLMKMIAGIDPRREIPAFAREPMTQSRLSSLLMRQALESAAPNGMVVLWVDSFTRSFSPEVVRATITLLNEAGFEVVAPPRSLCCGLTWITTGQLDTARERLQHTISVLAEYAREGLPIVGIEPSCVATLRSDAVALLGETRDALAVARATHTLAELLVGSPDSPRDLSWMQNRLKGVSIVAQPHCHHYSVMGWDADQAVLEFAGAELTILSGCCGLAGNFGMEKGHYELSKAIADRLLLPSLRNAKQGTVFLADGFSCRTQAHQLSGWHGKHLAQLLASESF